MIDLPSLSALVANFAPADDGAAVKSRELVLALLTHTPTPLSRTQFTPGHITCTGLVLHPQREAFLLIHHKRLARWLLPGGHVEPTDAEISLAARREVEEETSAILASAEAPLVGIDVHGIPPNPRKSEPFHLHHDLIFLFRASSSDVRPTKEVHAAVWQDLDPLSECPHHIPENIRLAAARSLAARDFQR